MTRNLFLLALIPLAILSFTFKSPEPMGKKKKWVALFNGKNLDGWTMKINGIPMGENFGNTFRVENGILSVKYDQYKTFDSRFGALYYKKKFTNYRLKVEYRFVGELTPGAPAWGFRDSGVQYHCQSPESVGLNQQFPVCLEFNLHGGNGKDARPTGEICALGTFVEINGKRNESNCTPPTTKRTFHGDQWVTLEIDVQGEKIIHFINGEEVIRFENPRFRLDHDIAKAMINGTDDKVRDGYLSLQSNSHPIDFRKIEVLEY